VIVETCTFTLVPGTADADFLAADRRVQTELVPNQPGFLRRTTAHRDGRWLVVTLWATEEDAARFADVAARHPLAAAFERYVTPDSTRADRYDTLD